MVIKIEELNEEQLRQLINNSIPEERKFILEIYEEFTDEIITTYEIIKGQVREVEIERYHRGSLDNIIIKKAVIPLTDLVIILMKENGEYRRLYVFNGEGWFKVFL